MSKKITRYIIIVLREDLTTALFDLLEHDKPLSTITDSDGNNYLTILRRTQDLGE